MTTRSASSCGAQAGRRRAIEAQRSLQLAANRGGREAGGDEAERGLARVVGADQSNDLAVIEAQVDVVEHDSGVPRVPVALDRQLEHRQGIAGKVPETRRAMATTRAANRSARATSCVVLSGRRHSR